MPSSTSSSDDEDEDQEQNGEPEVLVVEQYVQRVLVSENLIQSIILGNLGFRGAIQ